MSEVNKIQPQRFIDRKDWKDIVKACGGFYKRGHQLVPNWMVTIFFVTQLIFIGAMVYFSFLIIDTMQEQSDILSVINFMLLAFVVVTLYSLFIVRRMKSALTATEFMSLFLSKSLEAYSSCFALINKEGKVIFFNENFGKEYMAEDDVVNKTYHDILHPDYFNEKNLEKISDSIRKKEESSFSIVNSTNNSQTMRNIKIIPLDRPDGIFALKVVTVKIIKGAKGAQAVAKQAGLIE